jgi:hypothetical protein
MFRIVLQSSSYKQLKNEVEAVLKEPFKISSCSTVEAVKLALAEEEHKINRLIGKIKLEDDSFNLHEREKKQLRENFLLPLFNRQVDIYFYLNNMNDEEDVYIAKKYKSYQKIAKDIEKSLTYDRLQKEVKHALKKEYAFYGKEEKFAYENFARDNCEEVFVDSDPYRNEDFALKKLIAKINLEYKGYNISEDDKETIPEKFLLPLYEKRMSLYAYEIRVKGEALPEHRKIQLEEKYDRCQEKINALAIKRNSCGIS